MDIQAVAAVVAPVVSELLALWGVPGVVAAVAIAAFIWWTKATAGLRTEQETTITRQDRRIESLIDERDRALERVEKWRESYYAVRYPGSAHEDVAAREGLDKESA